MHTQGPWTVERVAHHQGGTMNRVMSGDTPIADPLQTEEDSDSSETNARLIAAAPDLYKALHAMASSFHAVEYMEPHMREAADMARAALAKVEV